jgi:hypothetical protein
MLYRNCKVHSEEEICVLSISVSVLTDIPTVVIADGNAASDYTKFLKSPDGLGEIDKEQVFLEYWTDANQIREFQNKRVICAEVLVPGKVDPSYIQNLYVSSTSTQTALRSAGVLKSITVNKRLFFL